MIRKDNSSNKIFIIIIALLLIANMVTLTFLLTGKPQQAEDRKNVMRTYLKKELGFGPKQLERFDTLKARHRTNVKNMLEEVKQQKQDNLRSLSNTGFSDSAVAVAAKLAGLQQENIELKFLKHLREIRSLCTQEQLVGFDTGFYKIMLKQGPGSKKK